MKHLFRGNIENRNINLLEKQFLKQDPDSKKWHEFYIKIGFVK